MKRVLLPLMAFLGVAAIAAAIAIPLYLVPKLKVVPLDLDITSVSTTVPAEGQTGNRFPAVIFDRCSVTKRRAAQFDAHLTQQRRSVIVNPSDENQATLQSAQTVRIDRVRDADGDERDLTMATDGDRTCDDALLTATVDHVSVSRKTSVPNGNVSSLQLEAVPEGGDVADASVQLDDRKGFQYKFGFDVGKRDYFYYDTTTRQDSTAKFVEEKEIDGVTTYHFVADVPETDLSNLPDPSGEAPLGTILNMPARWWGISGRGVKRTDLVELHRYAKATRHVFVEPTTGTIVSGYEDQEQYFKSPDDSSETPKAVRDFRFDAMKARFAWSDETVSAQSDRAKHYLSQLKWGGTYAPIILGVVGALLLIGAGLLAWLGRKAGKGDEPTDPDDGPDGGDPAGPPPSDDPTNVYSPVDGPTDPYAYEPVGDQTPATTVLPAVSPGADTTVIPAQPYPEPMPAQPYPEAPPQTEPAHEPWRRESRQVDDSQWQPMAAAPADDGGTPPTGASSPADDVDTGAFRSPYVDPTRPMPDPDRYRDEE